MTIFIKGAINRAITTFIQTSDSVKTTIYELINLKKQNEKIAILIRNHENFKAIVDVMQKQQHITIVTINQLKLDYE